MKGFCLEVSGPFACFTRPEMKAERVSYDVITPAAARGIFDAILWKPAIFWQIKRLEVLEPIRWTSIRRNEVAGIANPKSKGVFIEEDRQQRASLVLRDVKYRLFATFEYIPPADRSNSQEAGESESEAKYAAMFERRAAKGQFFHQPYLGCREFACDFRLLDPATDTPAPIPVSSDLGWMLYDLDFSDEKNIKPIFYRAKMENGVIQVPERDSEEVRQ